MAQTTIPNKCPICNDALYHAENEFLEEAVFIVKTRLAEPTHDDRVRLAHYGNTKPRLCICLECYERVLQPILFGTTDFSGV